VSPSKGKLMSCSWKEKFNATETLILLNSGRFWIVQ
jgi:hypothetical protein